MNFDLTGGAIQGIMTGMKLEKPILQVLGQKKISSSGGADRYRLLLSDGGHTYSSAMLATQLNDKIVNGDLESFCVIQLNKYLCNTIQPDRRVMILLDIEVLATGPEIGERIGNPLPFKLSAAASGNAVQETPAAPSPKPLANNSAATNSGGSFYGKKNATPVATKPAFNQNVPNTPGGTPARVHPINSLTPYQNRWTIRARVTSKSSIRTWSNSRGEGKLFSMNLLDESGEIKATAFRDEVDRLYDMVEVNKVYYISRATLKTADKRYSSINNDYEMTFNSDSQVMPCTEETDLPSVSFNFVQISQLDQTAPNTIVDVIGVVKSVADINTVVGKASNKEIKKRDVQIVDQGKVQIRMTLWGNDAENFNHTDSPVISVKGAKLSDWGGRSLSALASSQIILNPDIPEAHQLRGWFDSVGHSLDYGEYKNEGSSGGGMSTNWKTFADVKNQNISGDKAEYFTTKGTIVFLRKENCMYTACPSENCNKKVIDQGNGSYRCEKCQKEYPNFKYRLILSSNLVDFSDNQWVTCFQETAETVLGKTADELGYMKDNDDTAFDQVFTEANFKSYVFKCRAKMETYNDESRLKTVCLSATPVDYKDYNKRLIEEIERLAA